MPACPGITSLGANQGLSCPRSEQLCMGCSSDGTAFECSCDDDAGAPLPDGGAFTWSCKPAYGYLCK
jgi:hypothetical protein